MACVDFPTEDENVLLAEMRQQNLKTDWGKRLATARLAVINRFRQDQERINEDLSDEDVKVLETLDLPEEEILFQGRMILMYGSLRFERADDFGKAELLDRRLSTGAKVAQPMHPLIWKTRVSMLQETVRQYQTTDEGYAKLRGKAESGPKLREVGDWKSSTFPKEGGVKELPKNKSIGNHAENLAAAHLDSIRPGLNIVGVIENSSGQGIDLITRDTNTGRLVAVEIKGQDMRTKAKAPHQLLKDTKEHGRQGSEEWLHHHIMGMAMQKAADMATSRPAGSSQVDIMSRADDAFALERELLTQKEGLDTYVIAAHAKDGGMTTRISYRKGGETEFKEITAKPQYMSLDSVAPPKVKEVPDMSQDLGVIREMKTQHLADGNGTPRNSDEEV